MKYQSQDGQTLHAQEHSLGVPGPPTDINHREADIRLPWLHVDSHFGELLQHCLCLPLTCVH